MRSACGEEGATTVHAYTLKNNRVLFFRTRRAQVKTLTTERAKELFFTFRISALNPGYPLTVITTADEVIDDFRNPFYPEASVGFGVHFIIFFGEVHASGRSPR